MRRSLRTWLSAIVLTVIAASPAYAIPQNCWVRTDDDCWFRAVWEAVGDRTYWYVSCDDGAYYSGDLAGDQTSILCPST